jgi:transmembrane sensor
MSNRADTEAVSAAAARWVARRDAGLSPSETAELGQWLDADARHKAAFEHYARAWSTFERPVRAGARDAMMRELENRARRRRARAVAAIACVVVAFAFFALWRQPGAGGLHASGVVVMQPERHVLEDGSTVELKPGAVIDVRYDGVARRVVLVSGEAHFQVTKGQPRPFVVEAGGMEVRAVGTAFAVQLGVAQVEVLVTEGRVAVEKPSAAPALPRATTLMPADATSATVTPPPSAHAAPVPAVPIVPVATLGAREHVVVATAPEASAPVVKPVTSAELNERLAWRIPRLEFSATPLAEAVALINRSSYLPDGSAGARLVLDPASPGLAAEPVSGFFRADNIEAFVRVLGLSMGIEAERRDTEIILRRTRR